MTSALVSEDANELTDLSRYCLFMDVVPTGVVSAQRVLWQLRTPVGHTSFQYDGQIRNEEQVELSVNGK